MLIFLIFQLSLIQVILILPKETRNQLFLKYAKKISYDTIDVGTMDSYLEAIPYEKEKIEELKNKYNFPDSYNFINDTNAKVNIKDQKSCGCCWAMAATTSLAYRYHKLGVEVDLSPQHELSCYKSDCNGNRGIDAQLSLIKNGTITEECLPFSSGDKIIEECPVNSCKDPKIEYKKFYSKNAYEIIMNQNNFYDVTAIIIDQLLTKGPVVTDITVYEDFNNLAKDENCTNKVYTYDGVSKERGGHALSLVGYGILNEKYYWLLQNSWGNKSCNDGFIKVEFGQVGVGTIAFSEPYFEEEESHEVINVKFGKIDMDCNLEVICDNNLSTWKSQLNILFNHSDEFKEFDYICGVNKLINENETKTYCYYETNNDKSYKGIYQYKSFKSIGKDNSFKLDNSFEGLQFYYYGEDEIIPLSIVVSGINIYYFISEKGSRISFIYKPLGIDHNMPPIIANDNHGTPLSNCNKTTIDINKGQDYYGSIAYCDINEEELNYFDDYSTKSDRKMLNRVRCGIHLYQDIITYRLDKDKYPIFRIKHFYASINQSSISTILLADIEGSISGYNENNNSFLIFVSVEIGNDSFYNNMICPVGNPKNLEKNFTIKCDFQFVHKNKIDNVYLLPYYTIINLDYPFEVIIKDVMKNEDYIPPTPTPTKSRYIKNSIILLLLLFSL